MGAVVELIEVSKHYGGVQALANVSLSVEAGEVVAMLGPNGAGKTTSISLMLGLRRPTAGQVRLFGLSPLHLRARTRCGVMLQESGVPFNLKVRELVQLFRSYYPSPLPAAQVIQMAGLEEKANSRAADLSGGQLQRLYYALAICGDPDVLFLDEPTVGMDVEGRRAFWTNIRRSVESGKTIILTTHYLEEADALADRIVVVDRGRIIADAPPVEIKARFAGKRVAFESDRTLGREDFAGLPINGLEIRNQSVRFFSNQPETVLRTLVGRGMWMRNLEVVGVDLEEAFLRLTGQLEHAEGDIHPAAPAPVSDTVVLSTPQGASTETTYRLPAMRRPFLQRIADGESAQYPIKKPLAIGRSRYNDIVVEDPKISRRHAEVVISESDVLIRDLNSTNGTRVNGEQILRDRPLREGDVITIGDASFIYHDDLGTARRG